MIKAKIEIFFKWWYSIHPMNVLTFDRWINLYGGHKR